MRSYSPSATQSWYPSPFVILKTVTGETFGRVPIAFLEQAHSTVPTGALVINIVRILIVEPGHLERDGSVLKETDIAVAGTYVFNSSTDTVTYAFGPQGKTTRKIFDDTDSEAQISRSSRSSKNQSEFRFDLAARDGKCLVTGVKNKARLEACHIVPFNRGEKLLQEILGGDTDMDLYSPRNGLYLESTLHKTYDRYMWGVYTKDDKHVIHNFADPDMNEYHGQTLLYREFDPKYHPDKQLLDWHYGQCVMARIRGFSVD